MSIVQILFSANGRIRRRDYWLWSIVMSVGVMVMEFIGHHLLSGHPASQYVTDISSVCNFSNFTPFHQFIVAIILVMLWPGFCLAVKRWHDRNRSAYVALVFWLVGWAAIFLEIYFGPKSPHINIPIYYGTIAVSLAASIWVFVECGCLDGTKGPNKYGPSPKQIPAPADVF